MKAVAMSALTVGHPAEAGAASGDSPSAKTSPRPASPAFCKGIRVRRP